jgi:hypothetical protein
MTEHELGWLAPGPMWGAFGDLADPERRRRFARPAILRFASDAFMEELTGALALYPEKLAQWQARWESWEQPMTPPPAAARLPLNEPLSRRAVQQVRAPALLERKSRTGELAVSPAPEPDPDPERPLKLYQPVQNRFYLVSASLVCQRPGLPDRHVNPGKQEQAGFVLRRRIAPESGGGSDPLSWDEYAYVRTAQGPRWQKLPAGAGAAALLPGEERLPMFSLGYTDSGNHGRRLFAGLIPVGRREAYVGAALSGDAAGGAASGGTAAAEDAGPDTRELLFALQVTGPWRELIEAVRLQRAKFAGWPTGKTDPDGSLSDPRRVRELVQARQRAQTSSWYVLLDFVRFLKAHVSPVWEVLAGQRSRSTLTINGAEDSLLTYLERIVVKEEFKPLLLAGATGSAYSAADIRPSLMSALASLASSPSTQDALEAAELPFAFTSATGWPSFLFPLADPDLTYGPCPLVADGVSLHGGTADATNPGFDDILAPIGAMFTELAGRIRAALPARAGSAQPDINIATDLPLADSDAWFTIRCVYECPNCGPLKPPLLSAPTEPFQMAGFFDPDAPARQVRIPMPINISPAALRRYNKSATLVVSDMLCGQLKRIRKLTLGDLVLSVLPWPFHKDLPEPGPAGSCADSAGAFGMLCSLSIPIVTLCALILLLIIVALFDLFFRWIPLLFLCFPIPGFKARK